MIHSSKNHKADYTQSGLSQLSRLTKHCDILTLSRSQSFLIQSGQIEFITKLVKCKDTDHTGTSFCLNFVNGKKKSFNVTEIQKQMRTNVLTLFLRRMGYSVSKEKSVTCWQLRFFIWKRFRLKRKITFSTLFLLMVGLSILKGKKWDLL